MSRNGIIKACKETTTERINKGLKQINNGDIADPLDWCNDTEYDIMWFEKEKNNALWNKIKEEAMGNEEDFIEKMANLTMDEEVKKELEEMTYEEEEEDEDEKEMTYEEIKNVLVANDWKVTAEIEEFLPIEDGGNTIARFFDDDYAAELEFIYSSGESLPLAPWLYVDNNGVVDCKFSRYDGENFHMFLGEEYADEWIAEKSDGKFETVDEFLNQED